MLPVATLLPPRARAILIAAATTHKIAEINAAIYAVKKLYPQFFR